MKKFTSPTDFFDLWGANDNVRKIATELATKEHAIKKSEAQIIQ